MKRTTQLSAALGLAALLGAPSLFAQRGPGGGWGAGSRFNHIYNPQSVETITGEVVKVEKVAPIRGMGHGVHLEVKTESGLVPVHLGPAWFIDNQEIQIKPQDQVQITGSRVTLEGREVVIAAEVKDGSEVLKLRDASGIPVWAGWRPAATGAASGPGGMMMGPGGMGTNMMAQRKEMMEEHQKMMAEMKAMDADLQKKVAAMNAAQGTAKVDAMAEVLNALVKEHHAMHQHMAEMQGRMMMPPPMHPMHPGRGGPQPNAADDSSGKSSQPGRE